jgi:aspartyl-tRNA(Asn)/glutamyl-tRNA(Gln) amidotransferase subunit B
MNSFRFVERALIYEIERQIAVVTSGGKVSQETRLWDSDKGMSYSMRGKEEAHDYRYFPDPDLLPIVVDNEWIERIKVSMPELPAIKRKRFIEQYGIPSYDSGVLCSDKYLAAYFEECVKLHSNPKAVGNWIMSELMRELKALDGDIRKSPISAANLARMIKMVDEGAITGKIAKTVFEKMWVTGKDPDTIVETEGLKPVGDVAGYVDEVIKNNPKEVEQYLKGKEKLIGFFVGQVMRASGGRADPNSVNKTVREKLEEIRKGKK